MKRFLIKITIFGVVILSSMLLVFLNADGKSDPFYKKFTTSKQSSLFLGSSRVAHGIIPSVINNELKEIKSYNYAFTYNTSGYGPTYLNSIKRKLDTTVKDQIFILGVNPWALSNNSEDPNDLDLFLEKNSFLGTLTTVNSNPNFNYLIHNYSEPYIKILYNRTPFIVDDDGYLKLILPLTAKRALEKEQESIANFTEVSNDYLFSTLRLSYLKETILYLKPYGDVYVLRMPIGKGLFNVEKEFMPNFDEMMHDLTSEMNISYLNFTNEVNDYHYIDGHHLFPESANKLSLEIATRIKPLNQ
ncbi:MAG: hypothetical protein V7719_01690 [Psychroserpens sp.]|uniref:hypothetical protein n=1 Tax=Psychroserpens sp. TaxID=2020870 RepID=UPI003002C4AF